MKTPACVAISDIHFNLQTLSVASAALASAIETANRLKVPLVIAGDLNDSKAIIRAEVANRLLLLLSQARTKVYVLEGNHDKVNEKGDEHGLLYLERYATIVDKTKSAAEISPNFVFMPYQNSVEKVRLNLSYIKPGSVVIMHQGVKGAKMGDYVVDNTSINAQELDPFIVYSGHYHLHQSIGQVTYIGSPYTVTFGEARDGAKGFLIINSDGSFDRKILNLRAHRIYDINVYALKKQLEDGNGYGTLTNLSDDLIWLKISGPKSELAKLNKNEIGLKLFGHSNFKLDKIYTECDDVRQEAKESASSTSDVMDGVIDSTDESKETKTQLKKLWRDIV